MNKVIYANIMSTNILSRNEKLFLTDLISLTRNSDKVFAGNAYFAEKYGVTIRTVNRWLEKLKRLQLIKTQLVRYYKSYMVKKRYIYINMDKVMGLEGVSGTTDTVIDDEIQYSKVIPKSEKHMLTMLIKYSQIKGYVWATDNHFAKIFGVSESTIRRWLNNLEANGYIEIDRGILRRIFVLLSRKSVVYRLIRKPFSIFNKCKNVMYSVTSFIHTRKKILMHILCNLIHINAP